MKYYYFVQTAIKWRSKEPNLQHTIYCPGGEYNSGIFVAVSSFSVYHVITFAREGIEKLLYRAMTETKIIKWTADVRFPAIIKSRIISAVESITETLNHTKGTEIEVHEGYNLDRIKPSHVPLIHSLWDGRDPKRPYYYQEKITNSSPGLYKKNMVKSVWFIRSKNAEE
ncbi:uncharacterized protein LOC117182970 [Belonocnema kinseyi]|uniref:uncharacterized protein LOC117182970 n=1 Tax=Belonocnema kinseyi TaxID=2817044 RepID=UPI00143CDB7E|nr:uncharacterized protein LOC117182970 [Belonocnema kinseyi]